ncbi:MAG: helix-turn-helix domain-containing protein, partial [Cyanobacteria bacterium J06638_6]
IASHLERLIHQGEAVDIDQVVDPDRQRKIRSVLAEMENAPLTELRDRIGSTVSYEDIRLVRAMWYQEQASG